MGRNDNSQPQFILFNLAFILVAVFGFGFWKIINVASENIGSPLRYGYATVAPVICASVGYYKKSLDFSGYLAALVIGFLLTISNYCFSTSLIVFFFTASSVTKFRSVKKRQLEENFKEGGRRNWVQVLCNGLIAAAIALIYTIDIGLKETPVNFISSYNASWLSMSVLGALACSCGDTFASELGPVLWCGEPRLITNFRKVPKGTNGGVSLAGLLASVLGGLIVGVTYYLTLLFSLNQRLLYKSPPQWPIVLQGIWGGLVGSLIDSLLGATVQYSGYDTKRRVIVEHPGPFVEHISGQRWLSNHSVNLVSGFITAMLSPSVAYYIWPFFS